MLLLLFGVDAQQGSPMILFLRDGGLSQTHTFYRCELIVLKKNLILLYVFHG